MSNRLINTLFGCALALLVILDQLSKWAVTEILLRPLTQPDATQATAPLSLWEWIFNPPPRLPFTEIIVWPFFNLVMVWNKGVSFGLFNQHSTYGPMLLSGFSVLIIAIFAGWFFRAPHSLQKAGIIMVIAGALGNVLDRLRFGAVIDFLDFHIYDYHWPAFNIADSLIVLGVGLLLMHSFFEQKPLHQTPEV